MFKLDAIASFVAIVEAGSMSAAARQLHVSKSVVSERLSELERALGAALFHRTTRKMSLTEDGQEFHERAVRIMAEVEAAAAEISERRGQLTGPMRLSAPVTFGRMHLGPALYPFLAQNPDITMTLELDDRRVDAAAEGFDAVLRHGPITDSRLVAWILAPSRRILVASPAYLARHSRPQELPDLAQHRSIQYMNRGTADWRFLDASSGEYIRPAWALRVNNGDMMRDAAVAGLGLALLPEFIVSQDLRSGTLEALPLQGVGAEEFVYLAHAEGRRVSAKLRALAAALRSAFGAPPYWQVQD